MRVLVYTKSGCHLCDDACAVVASVCGDAGAEWAAQDIASDDELMARWGEYVPVILVDGEVHDWFRADAERLRTALIASRRGSLGDN
jgi:glutaredoxin